MAGARRVGVGILRETSKDLGVAAQEAHEQQRHQREHDRLHGDDRGEGGHAVDRDHRQLASIVQVNWSTAAEQLQFRQSIRHGIMHVTSRHWIVPRLWICVLHCP